MTADVLVLLYAATPERMMLTVPEVAPILLMSTSAAYEAARRGDFPSRKVGRRILVPLPLLREWLGIIVRPTDEDDDDDAPVVALVPGEDA